MGVIPFFSPSRLGQQRHKLGSDAPGVIDRRLVEQVHLVPIRPILEQQPRALETTPQAGAGGLLESGGVGGEVQGGPSGSGSLSPNKSAADI